jgi:alkane 1-monooxygenase
VSSLFATNVAHELYHKKSMFLKVSGILQIVKLLTSHAIISHNYTHHKYVATPLDSSTARMGETIYSFLFRIFPQEFMEAWNIELNRLKEHKCTSLWDILNYNRVSISLLVQLLYLTVVATFFGARSVCFHLVYSFIGYYFLEAVQYI